MRRCQQSPRISGNLGFSARTHYTDNILKKRVVICQLNGRGTGGDLTSVWCTGTLTLSSTANRSRSPSFAEAKCD